MSATPTTNGAIAPPHNLEAEQSVLGAIMLTDRPMYALVIEEGLRPEDFYWERHRLIYEAMLGLYNESAPVDTVTVTERLRQSGKLEEAGGSAAVAELGGLVPAVGHSRRYAQIVRENALLRRLLTATYEVQASVLGHAGPPRELVEQAEKLMLEVARDDRHQDFRSIEAVLHDEIDKLHRLSQEHTSLTGTPSGFKDLDDITGGFQPGNLIVIASRPSMGKSSLVANIAENAAVDHGQGVALFSLEMSEAELAQRFIASQARIKGDELRKGRVAENRWPKIVQASTRLATAPLWIDDSSDVGLLEVRAKARRLHTQSRLGLIIVDYLQLMRADGRTENRVEQIGHISRGLKILARELDVPVIALSQLNRSVESRTDRRPILSDLRESGCLTGETLVFLPDTGERCPIRELVGREGVRVLALKRQTWRLEPRRVLRAWCTGVKPVMHVATALGRSIRATANHRFLTLAGWRRLDELQPGDRIAVGAVGAKVADAVSLLVHLREVTANTNRDVIPREAWSSVVKPAMASAGVTARAMQSSIGTRYCGSTIFATNIGRERAERVATAVRSRELALLATSDVYWDTIRSVEPDATEPVFDLTVDGLHNFVANDIVVHNSIEQDADLVAFIYRDEYYNEDSDRIGEADLIIAKHRNGGLGTVTLTFHKEYPKFMNYAGARYGT